MGQSTICNMKQFIPFLYKEIRQCLSIEFLDCHIVVSAVCGKSSHSSVELDVYWYEHICSGRFQKFIN